MKAASLVQIGLGALAVFSLVGVAAGQCQHVATSTGLRSDRVPVSAITTWDPDGVGPLPATIVVAGVAQLGQPLAPLQNDIATFDSATGSAVPLGTAQGLVRVLDVLPNGDLLAAGDFLTVGAAGRYLAQFNGVAWSSLGVPPDDPVECTLVHANGDLVVGGRFRSIGGLAALSYLAKWDGQQWSGLGAAPNGRIRAIAVDAAGNIVVGGDFTSIGGVFANRIASWNGSVWSPLGAGTDAHVNSITLLPNGNLAVGGAFLQAGGLPGLYLAQWNGTTWSQIGGPVNNTVLWSVLLRNGDLLITGLFTSIAGQPVVSNAIWNGSAWSAPPVPISARYATRLAGAQVLWPYFETSQGYVVVGGGVDAQVFQAEVDSTGALYISGRFSQVAGVPARGVARFNGTVWSALGSGISSSGSTGGPVAMCIDEHDHVYFGGSFFTAGGASGFVMRWDGVNYTVVGGGTNSIVYTLTARPGGGVYVGGMFTSAGDVAARGLAEWDGSSWSAMGDVNAGACAGLARLRNGDVIAVGVFYNPSSRVIRWNGTTWSALPTVGSSVTCVAELPDGSIIVGGLLTTGSSGMASNVVRFNGSTWVPVGALTQHVSALAVLPDGDILSNASIGLRHGVVRWDGSSWQPFAGVHGVPYDFARLPDGSMAVVGQLVAAAGVPVDSFALIESTCPAAVASDSSGCVGPTLAAQTIGLPWIGSTFRVEAQGFLPGSLGAVLIGLHSPNLLLSSLTPIGLPGCQLLASADISVLLAPTAGQVSLSLTLPRNPAFVGVILFEQFLEVRHPGGPGVALSSSNGLRQLLGAF